MMGDCQRNKATAVDAPTAIIQNTTHTDIVSKAIAAALQIGVELPRDIPFGKHRFPGAGKKESNQACAVNRSSDAILIFDHSTQLSAYAFEDSCSNLSLAEFKELKMKSEAARRRRIVEKKCGYDRAALEINKVILTLPEAQPCFPYFVRKQIESYSSLFRAHTRYGKPCVVIPLEYKGLIVNWQSIDEQGHKRPFKGARSAGAYAVIACPEEHRQVLIAEGVATACTVAMLERESIVIAAMFAYNLLSVARTFRELYPRHEIVICGDNDRDTEKRTGTNPGRSRANEAARAVSGMVVFPEFPPGVSGSDFNDLMCAGYLL